MLVFVLCPNRGPKRKKKTERCRLVLINIYLVPTLCQEALYISQEANMFSKETEGFGLVYFLQS